MDPFSSEGELLNIHNAFHQGQYDEVVAFDTSSFSASNKLPARVLKLRAQLALGNATEVLAEVNNDDKVADLAAVKALALYQSGKEAQGLKLAETLAKEQVDNATVLILAGTVLENAGQSEEALALLSGHQGNLEAVALIVQIHLQQNRTDLALKEVQDAKRWAQDSQLINFAEAWVGLRMGGERYQQAYYVFEELAQAPSTSAVKTIVGQAIAELHLGRLPEAEAALQQVLKENPKDGDVIANTAVLTVVSGKDPKDLISSLEASRPDHPMLMDLEEKSESFDKAASKFSARVAG